MQSTKVRMAVLALAVVAGVALFIVLNEGDDEQSSSPTPAQAPTRSRDSRGGQADATAGKPLATVTVRDGRPQGGVQELSFASGGEVEFRVVSDTEAEVHVHGYDLEQEVSPGEPLTMRFPADIEGGFEVELHLPDGSEVQIAELSVTPS
jgi:hypothetical protein